MSGQSTTKGSVCPHCGKPVHVRWTSLLPSNNRNRSYKCEACGKLYDLSDASKTASILAGVLSLGPAVLIFGRIIRGHGVSPLALKLIGTGMIIAFFALASVAAGRLALGLVRKA